MSATMPAPASEAAAGGAGAAPNEESLARARRELFGLCFPEVAHGLGNMLGNVQGRAEMMLHRAPVPEKSRQYLELIVSRVESADRALKHWVLWLGGPETPGEGRFPLESLFSQFLAPLMPVLEKLSLAWETNSLPEQCSAAQYGMIEETASALLAVVLAEPPPLPAAIALEVASPQGSPGSGEQSRIALTLEAHPAAGPRDAEPTPPALPPDYLSGRAAALGSRLSGEFTAETPQGRLVLTRILPHG